MRKFELTKILYTLFLIAFISASFLFDLNCKKFQNKQKNEIQKIDKNNRDIYYITNNLQNYDSLYSLGKLHAIQDLNDGKLIIKYVFNPGQTSQYFDVLKNDYNIILDPVSDGFLGHKESAYFDGYNSISVAEIKKQFGDDVFKRASDKVKVWFDIEPKLIKRAKLDYPEEALKQGIEGRVHARVLLDKSGIPKKVEILSGEKIFHDAAIKMVMQSIFSGGTLNGEPAEIWISWPIDFKINQ